MLWPTTERGLGTNNSGQERWTSAFGHLALGFTTNTHVILDHLLSFSVDPIIKRVERTVKKNQTIFGRICCNSRCVGGRGGKRTPRIGSGPAWQHGAEKKKCLAGRRQGGIG